MVILGDNVSMKNDCRIMITGNNCTIEIGDNTSFTHHCQLEAQEEATHIIIGEDCMFSNNVLIRLMIATIFMIWKQENGLICLGMYI